MAKSVLDGKPRNRFEPSLGAHLSRVTKASQTKLPICVSAICLMPLDWPSPVAKAVRVSFRMHRSFFRLLAASFWLAARGDALAIAPQRMQPLAEADFD